MLVGGSNQECEQESKGESLPKGKKKDVSGLNC